MKKLNGFHFMFQNSNISKSIIQLFAGVFENARRAGGLDRPLCCHSEGCLHVPGLQICPSASQLPLRFPGPPPPPPTCVRCPLPPFFSSSQHPQRCEPADSPLHLYRSPAPRPSPGASVPRDAPGDRCMPHALRRATGSHPSASDGSATGPRVSPISNHHTISRGGC